MSFWFCLLFVSVIALVWYSTKLLLIIAIPYRASSLNKIPGPSQGNFLMGNAIEIMKEPPLQKHIEWANKYKAPLIHYRFIWNSETVLVVDPALVQVVCNSPSIFTKEKLPGYALLRFALGNGLITLNGEEHKNHRKLISPAFKHSSLKDLLHIFIEQTKQLLNELDDTTDGDKICVNEIMNKVTLNIIGLAGFGFDFTAFDSDKDTVGSKTYKAFSELISMHNILFTFFPILKYAPHPRTLKAGKNLLYLNRVVLELVKTKRASLNSREGTRDVLDLLIEAHDEDTGFKLTDNELSAHVKTFLGAGHETTSMLLTWTFYVLSQNPEVANKMRTEITEVIGDNDSYDFTIADLEKLVYMGYILKEVLRMFPPVATVARITSCKTTLGEYEIPKDTIILVSPRVLGHDKSVWDNPDEFRPERWESDNSHSFQFIPFLKGPRNCIGQKFAMLEAKVILTMVARKYRFDMTPSDYAKVESVLHVTMRPKDDLIMNISRI